MKRAGKICFLRQQERHHQTLGMELHVILIFYLRVLIVICREMELFDPIGYITSGDTHVSVELTHMKLLTAEVILHPPYTNLLMMAYYILVAVLSSFHRRFILRFTEQYDEGIAL